MLKNIYLNEIQINKGIEVLKEEFNPIVVYLFGSAARNELREDSDIDIAFLTDNDIDPYICFMKAQELADIFKREVDLINLNTSSTVFKAQVVGTGKYIYCSDDNKRMYFEMRALKEYALLNEERQVILNNIKERGSVYGNGYNSK
jgi:predicted nucleotidyltransferase